MRSSEEFWEESWRRAWSGVGAKGGGEEVMGELLAAYGEPGRSYHDLEHLEDCLRLLEANRDLADDLAAVEVALWFHDGVYDVQATDNEEKSADWAVEVLRGAGVEEERCECVRELILATLHGSAPEGGDAKLLVDIDLSILGASRERYDRYEEEIREEFSWVPEPIFRAQRAMILSRFLERERIYERARFYERFEEGARENIRRAIQRLKGL